MKLKQGKKKSKPGDLRLNFASAIHYHHSAFGLCSDNKTHGLTEGTKYKIFKNSE